MRITLLPALALLMGCPSPDSVPFGGLCKDVVECKDPADECVTAVGKQFCTTVCTTDKVCPESYVCARMDITVTEGGDASRKWTGERGYCLPAADVPPRAAKIRPKGKKRSKKRRKKKG